MQNKIWMAGMMLIAFLVGLRFSQNTMQAETAETVDPQRSKEEIQSIIEDCNLYGYVTDGGEVFGVFIGC